MVRLPGMSSSAPTACGGPQPHLHFTNAHLPTSPPHKNAAFAVRTCAGPHHARTRASGRSASRQRATPRLIALACWTSPRRRSVVEREPRGFARTTHDDTQPHTARALSTAHRRPRATPSADCRAARVSPKGGRTARARGDDDAARDGRAFVMLSSPRARGVSAEVHGAARSSCPAVGDSGSD
jgi:hypothetical protein